MQLRSDTWKGSGPWASWRLVLSSAASTGEHALLGIASKLAQNFDDRKGRERSGEVAVAE